MNYFEYFEQGREVMPEKAIRISPSQLSKFFDNTTVWYRENLLNEKTFEGSTSTALGTCVHAGACMYANEKTIDYQQIDNYINSLSSDYDKDFIKNVYPIMLDTLVNKYIKNNVPDLTEQFYWKEILPDGIGVGGTIDAIKFSGKADNITHLHKNRANAIIDYKTTSSKTLPTRFPRNYYFQQMAYAWLCKQHGIEIEFLKLIYITVPELDRYSETTGKKLKDRPSVVHKVIHKITPEDMIIIDNVIQLVAHSIQLWVTQPELRWALAQDWRFYTPAPANKKLFINK